MKSDKMLIGGGPAFPIPDTLIGNEQYQGMTLRDYFAAQVLATLMAPVARTEVNQPRATQYTETAYGWADLMLKTRESIATK